MLKKSSSSAPKECNISKNIWRSNHSEYMLAGFKSILLRENLRQLTQSLHQFVYQSVHSPHCQTVPGKAGQFELGW